MNKEEFLGFCIKNNLPFAVEFKKPWYPKPIEITPKYINDTRRLVESFKQSILDDLIYGCSIFHTTND